MGLLSWLLDTPGKIRFQYTDQHTEKIFEATISTNDICASDEMLIKMIRSALLVDGGIKAIDIKIIGKRRT